MNNFAFEIKAYGDIGILMINIMFKLDGLRRMSNVAREFKGFEPRTCFFVVNLIMILCLLPSLVVQTILFADWYKLYNEKGEIYNC